MAPFPMQARAFLNLPLRGRRVLRVLGCLLLAGAGALPAQNGHSPASGAGELVRRAAQHDLDEESNPRFLIYRARRQTPEGTRVTLRVETAQGPVGRIVSLNDRPLTPQEQAAVEAEQRRLLRDPGWLTKDQKQWKEESERRRRALSVLPDAFLFDYDGVEPDGRLRLKFRPNPNFDPPFREAQAFPGMEGRLWIDPQAERVVRIETQLFRDVDFGWGIIGRLYRGGHIEIENSRLADGTWRVTRINVDLSYRVLFSKRRAQQQVTYSGFQDVPGGLSLAQAIDLLRQYAGAPAAVLKK